MFIRKRLKNPKHMMLIGVSCLALANILPRFLHLTFNFGPDFIDAIRGLLFGLGIGLTLLSVRLNCRQQRCGD
jgi:hypothetical protein